MADRSTLVPTVLGAVVLAAFFGALLDPSVVLSTRDVPLFHLPLRTAFANLLLEGSVQWNPLLHGGQPLLSNPNYAAFYPPSWLALLVGPAYGLNLIALLHAALAFGGAWRLARYLGCGAGAASLTALGFAGGGAFVALLNSFNLYCGMAWFPWVLLWGDQALRRPGWRSARRPLVLCAAGLGLQLLAGEPVSVLISGIGLAALTAQRLRRAPEALLRLALVALLAAGLAAVQLVPTWARLQGTARSEGMALEKATLWSAPPARAVEILYPHVHGDPARTTEGLYFGQHLHEASYPYVVSIYPGLLLAVLGLAALVRWPIPRRGAWVGMAAAGVFLALGRYNPLYGIVHDWVPLVGMVRFPEKFVLPAVFALVFAGGLGWQRLLDREGRQGEREARFALLLGAGVLAGAVLLAAAWWGLSGFTESYVAARSPLPAAETSNGTEFLRRESLAGASVALGGVLLLVLAWRGRTRAATLSLLALVVLAADVWLHARRYVDVLSTEFIENPPPLAQALSEGEFRVFSDLTALGGVGKSSTDTLAFRLARVDPYCGNLWGIAYAVHSDYDVMQTDWAEWARRAFVEDWRSSELLALRNLGAWNGGVALLSPSAERQPGPIQVERSLLGPADVLRNPFLRQRYRIVPEVELHPDRGTALAAARREGYQVDLREHCVAGDEIGGPAQRRFAPARLLEVRDRGSRIELRYSAAGEAFAVVAVSYDEDWRADVGGRAVPVLPTALGQMGVVLPAGESSLTLEYRDPRVAWGAAVTGLSLLFCVGWVAAGRVGRRGIGGEPSPSSPHPPAP